MPVLGKSKKEVVTAFRTAEILEAARKVFAAQGFHKATVDEIANAAGVAKGTLYLYYRSKREIYWAALRNGITALFSQVKMKMQESETIEDKLYTFIAVKMRYFDENREFFKVYFSEFGSALTHPAEMHPDFKHLYLHQARVLEAALQEAIPRKTIRNLRADIAAIAISDLTRGMITQRLLGWSRAPVQDDIAFVFDLVWKGIAAR